MSSMSNLWVVEDLEDGLRFSYKLNKVLASTQSKFQKVDVADTEPFGKVLIIDGLMQSSQLDEYIYHESLVHPALLAHPNPKRVFIGGGGEGSTAREVLRHKSVEKCVMVDIDGDVVNFCKEHLTENKEAFADSRLDLVIDCCKAQLTQAKEKFDVIIMDLDDPLEGGPCFFLYCKEFYEFCKTKLNPGGILVTQSSGSGVKFHTTVFSPVYNTMKQVFPAVKAYNQAIYSFADEWGFVIGYSDAKTAEVTPAEIDKRIASRINGDLKFLDGESYQGLFCLNKAVRKTLAEEKRVLTEANPAVFLKHMEGVSEHTKETAAPLPAAAPKANYSEKKLKAVKKEGGKKGQDLAGMAAMGTLFQQAMLTESEGKLDLLEMQLEAMNVEVDPEAEERRGGAGDVAKILLSANDDTLACIVHVPEAYTVADKNERGYAFTAKEWAEAAFSTLPGDGKGAEYVVDTPTLVKIVYKKDAEAGRYPGKAKDNVSGQSFAWLRSKSLVPADDDSDDDMVFGDDDMPGF